MPVSYDWKLHAELMRMADEDPTLHRFYCRASWRRLRAHVLEEFHGACADCLDKSPAEYTPAECVHHVLEVQDKPGWALTEMVPDSKGSETRNLVPLCHECHDRRHGRFAGEARQREPTEPPLTPERW